MSEVFSKFLNDITMELVEVAFKKQEEQLDQLRKELSDAKEEIEVLREAQKSATDFIADKHFKLRIAIEALEKIADECDMHANIALEALAKLRKTEGDE